MLKVYVNNNTRSVRQVIPNRVRDIPVTLEERTLDREQHCDLKQYFYDPLPANVQIEGYEDGENSMHGSMGVVCWNDDENDPYECYITASHVITDNGGQYKYLLHDGYYDGEGREELVGEFVTHSPDTSDGLDVAKYRRRTGTVDADILGNGSDELPDTAGSWNFEGLTDATTSSTVEADFAGQTSCYINTECGPCLIA